ncbi:hypothetical protein PHISCL_00907 [Aspergillus sclerotialis]|uniref:Zn(2)-C6 fungal-type domain-containing protein n=1 Tax=Aspergillus sclerotialis TaxID=2070753 RepID=A0A3A3A9V5_9EURO|nr:hypothetical protein PHISCL_00907 [Aspergillus sclerotialis]
MAASGKNQSSDLSPSVPRRARIACKACNARRVKCDAADARPCWNCRIRQNPCELIESRRGKYERKRRGVRRDQQPSRRPLEVDDTSTGQTGQRPSVTSDAARNTIDTNPSDGSDMQFAGTSGPKPTQQNQTSSGESVSLSFVVEVVYSPKGGLTEPLKVHFPIPASIADRPAPNNGPCTEEPVSLREAFIMPAREVSDALIRAFFDVIHPAFPVFDRRNFTRLYHQGHASPLVLQAIFLLGFTIGGEDLVEAAGYSDRATARKTHYLRAKALYDADYETDRMNLVAVLLLLGFWWGSPEDQKDTCYWIGCATTVAQSLGMHRSPPQSMSQQMRSLRKRIWWSLYIRDRHTSAAFGRPCRIRDEDCDVEPLTVDDFNFDNEYDQTLILAQQDFHMSYFVEMTKLTTILGDILVGEFSPRRPALEKFNTDSLAGRLAQWQSQLPVELRQIAPDGSLGASFWATMLNFSYQYCHILLFRPKTIEVSSAAETERDVRARMAADSITRMAEDLLTAGTIKCVQIHLVPALFGALSIHTIVICRKDPIQQQVAENKARQCLLALSVLAKSWPVKIWISRAFVNLLRRLTGQGSASGGSIVKVSSSISNNNTSMAPSGRSDLPQQCQPSPTSSFSHVASRHSDTAEQNTQSTRINGQPRELHVPDYFPHIHDEYIYDSFPAGYLDNMLDVDMLLHSNIGPTLSMPFEGLNGSEEQDTTGL